MTYCLQKRCAFSLHCATDGLACELLLIYLFIYFLLSKFNTAAFFQRCVKYCITVIKANCNTVINVCELADERDRELCLGLNPEWFRGDREVHYLGYRASSNHPRSSAHK